MTHALRILTLLLTPLVGVAGCKKNDSSAPPVLPPAVIALPFVQTRIYVATDGNDSNAGISSKPLATLNKAVDLAKPGDSILVRSGTYYPSSSVILQKSGTKDKPICILAESKDQPVFDYSKASIPNDGAIEIRGAWWHLKGLVLTKSNIKAIYMAGTDAHNNILEQITTRQNANPGITISIGASENLILNCDSYQNFDLPRHGQNADGFVASFGVGINNRFKGCRSWNNSDDGFDCWEAGNAVRFEECYTWSNGVNLWNDPLFEGNGNGFKLGRGEGHHELVHCAAWNMEKSGFDLNGNTAGVHIDNCTAMNCKKFTFYIYHGLEGGGPETFVNNILRNNLSFGGTVMNRPGVVEKNNSWNIAGLVLSQADFQSTDPSSLQGARNEDGSLPAGSYMHLAQGSRAIDAGISTGQPFHGAAPDLGAFEY